MWPQVLFGVFLMGVSIVMLRVLRLRREEAMAAENRRSAVLSDSSRYRYRMLSSALIGLAGLLLVGGIFVRGPLPMAIYWTGEICVVLGIILFGMLDLGRSRAYLQQLQAEHQLERVKLEAEIAAHVRQRRERESTGDAEAGQS